MATTLLHQLDKEFDKYIREVFVQRMSEYPPEYPMYTKQKPWPSDGGLFQEFIRAYQRGKSIQPAIVKTETEAIETQQLSQGRTKDIYSVRFATGLAFSYDKMKIGIKALSSVNNVSELLGDAMRMTLENYFVAMLAEAANGSAPPELLGFDGKPLVANDHVLLGSPTAASNLYPSSAGVSYTVIHDLITMFGRIVNEDGLPYPVYRLNELWLPVEEEANALEVLKSIGRPDTAQRADNVIGSRTTVASLSPSSLKTPLYMPPTMWFACDGAKHTLSRYMLEAPKVEGPFIDEKTEERWWKTTVWVARAIWEWRGVVGIAL